MFSSYIRAITITYIQTVLIVEISTVLTGYNTLYQPPGVTFLAVCTTYDDRCDARGEPFKRNIIKLYHCRLPGILYKLGRPRST